MRRKRVFVALVSVTLGLIAGAVAYTYLSSVQRRAYNNAQLTSIYIAASTIPKGTSGAAAEAAGLIKRTQIPAEFRPANAIVSLGEITSAEAVSSIAQNEVLVGGLFALNNSTGGVAAQQIPSGDVAISVSVDAVHGVAGLIAPGDRVDLLIELSTGQKEVTLYQDVPVLAVGTVVASSETGGSGTGTSTPSSSSGLITFALPLDAAERVAMIESGAGSAVGSLYLALVPPGSKPTSAPQIGSSALIPATPVPS